MSFFVYGRDAKTGEVVKRFFSAAPTEAQARRDGEALGIEVTDVVRCRTDERAAALASSERVGAGVVNLSPSEMAAAPASPTLDAETEGFKRELEQLTPNVYITYALMGLNVLVFVVMLMSGASFTDPNVADLLRWGAEYGPKTTADEPWRLLSAMFVHIGSMHLVMNMIVLAYIGPIVERMIGNFGFLLLYLASGIGGGVLGLYWNPLLVHAGASGAIFGVYAGLLGLLLRQHGTIPPSMASGLRNFALIFVGYNLLYSFKPGVGMSVHLGGLATGFVCGLVLGQPYSRETVAARPLRNIVTAGFALILLGCGIVGAQTRYPHLAEMQQFLDRFVALDRKSNKAYKDAYDDTRRSEEKNATPAEWNAERAALDRKYQALADLIERDLLPAWSSMLADADRLPPVPSRYQDGMVAIHDYLHLRQEGWAMLMSALRTEHGKDFFDKKFAAEEKLRWLSDRLVVARNEGLLPSRY